MDLRPYVENLRNEFAVAAEGVDPEGRALAERLSTQLEAATRLMLLDALSDAADEITRELAPGSVHVRLRGREPDFVVTPAGPPADAADAAAEPPALPAPVLAPAGDDGGTSRINLRLPDQLKASVEEAAARAGLSVNAWLVRAVAGAIGAGEPDRRPARRVEPRSGQHFTGWAR
ncbi:toxin-antitoxin system HicB family antitoxin [Micromonospora sp. NPDC049301]|uniref:toxin-antitoxin system HicB family antitoxin n=1 Tax=Micromonospora sp. NPDC049301 TaxID=3155723 RepID=UPI00343CA2A0